MKFVNRTFGFWLLVNNQNKEMVVAAHLTGPQWKATDVFGNEVHFDVSFVTIEIQVKIWFQQTLEKLLGEFK